ncbi:MAG: hypothetical protein ACREOI_16555 [bacterium]
MKYNRRSQKLVRLQRIEYDEKSAALIFVLIKVALAAVGQLTRKQQQKLAERLISTTIRSENVTVL